MFDPNPVANPKLFLDRRPLVAHWHIQRLPGGSWEVLPGTFNLRSVENVDLTQLQIRPQADLPQVVAMQLTLNANAGENQSLSAPILAGRFQKTASGPGVWTRQGAGIGSLSTFGESGGVGTFELNVVPVIADAFVAQMVAQVTFEPAAADRSRWIAPYYVSDNQYNVQFRNTVGQTDPIIGDVVNLHFAQVLGSQQRIMNKVYIPTPGNQQIYLESIGPDGDGAWWGLGDEIIVDVYDRTIVASCQR